MNSDTTVLIAALILSKLDTAFAVSVLTISVDHQEWHNFACETYCSNSTLGLICSKHRGNAYLNKIKTSDSS